jgi:hypothetical protein
VSDSSVEANDAELFHAAHGEFRSFAVVWLDFLGQLCGIPSVVANPLKNPSFVRDDCELFDEALSAYGGLNHASILRARADRHWLTGLECAICGDKKTSAETWRSSILHRLPQVAETCTENDNDRSMAVAVQVSSLRRRGPSKP